MRKPFPIMLETRGAPGLSSSTALRSPIPRTSLMAEWRPLSSARPSRILSPRALQWERVSSEQRSSSAARPAAVARGFPPKVEAWSPGLKAEATSSLASVAPMGQPPASPLARVMMSGGTSQFW